MGKSKIQRDDGGGGASSEWLNTYADMVTLLLTFFILLYSMSSINVVKWDQLVQTYGQAQNKVSSVEGTDSEGKVEDVSKYVNDLLNIIEEAMQEMQESSESSSDLTGQGNAEGEKQVDFSEIYEILLQYVVSNDLQEKVGLDKTENEVLMRFKDKAFYKSGSATLNSEALPILQNISEAITLVIDQVDEIIIEGHTDSVPQKSWQFPNNRALGSARADSVSDCFEQYGLPPEKIVTKSYGEYRPIDTNDTEEGRSANRRVDIIVTRDKSNEDRYGYEYDIDTDSWIKSDEIPADTEPPLEEENGEAAEEEAESEN